MDEAARLLAPVRLLSPPPPRSPRTFYLPERRRYYAIDGNAAHRTHATRTTMRQRSPHLSGRCRPPCRKSEGRRVGEEDSRALCTLHLPRVRRGRVRRELAGPSLLEDTILILGREGLRRGKRGTLGERAIGRAGSRVRWFV